MDRYCTNALQPIISKKHHRVHFHLGPEKVPPRIWERSTYSQLACPQHFGFTPLPPPRWVQDMENCTTLEDPQAHTLGREGEGLKPKFYGHVICGDQSFFGSQQLHSSLVLKNKGWFLKMGGLEQEGDGFPEGSDRHLNAARQKLPRDDFCRSTAAQLPSPRGQFWKKKKETSLVGERQFGRHCKRQLGEGNCESKITARQWGVNFLREASRCLAGPCSSKTQGRGNENSARSFLTEVFFEPPPGVMDVRPKCLFF